MSDPYYQDDLVTLYHGDCIEVMRSDENGYDFTLGYGTKRALPDDSISAIITDPPYGLGFMGKEWDDLPPGLPWAQECLRVLKPGGHLLAFGGSRTWHRLAVALEDAGFEIRDSIAWLYGSGFPKSMDVSKAIDKAAGATRVDRPDPRWLERYPNGPGGGNLRPSSIGRNADGSSSLRRESALTTSDPVTVAAREWEGWGTALKPAFEPIVVARKPLTGTVAANVLEHGTGALNIDATRIVTNDNLNGGAYAKEGNRSESASLHAGSGMNVPGATTGKDYTAPTGRWPANVVLDESQAAALDEQTGVLTSGLMKARTNREPRKGGPIYGADNRNIVSGDTYGDQGGASRFFPTFALTAEDAAWQERMNNLPTFRYEAKAPGTERPDVDGVQHPTVKPLELMRWLVRLVTPWGGVVLEPFAGSGTALEACLLEGFDVIGIEREETYLPLIMQRITKPLQQSLFGEDIA